MNLTTTAALIQAARGDRPADLLLRNGRMVNVFTGAVMLTDIAVADGYVVGFGNYKAKVEIDLKGFYVAPGFIDAHVHIESAMVAPAQFAQAVLPRGTTTVVADPHEIANVLGTTGIDYMLAASADLPLHFFFTLPSCVPATAMETSGAGLDADALRPYLHHPRVVALAEMMNFPGVIHGDAGALAKLQAMGRAGKPLDGHAPGVSGRWLHAYAVPGIASDHECTTAAEAAEKLSVGMHIMVREGTGARNLDDLLPAITPQTSRRMMWCTDDRHPHDLLAEGSIDGMVRRAVRAGIDPITAIQMATLNPAEYFRLPHVGAIAPGRLADLVVLEDLNDPVVRQVFCAGELIAEESSLVERSDWPMAAATPSAMRVAPQHLNFKIPAQGRCMRVIEVVAHQIVTRAATAEAMVVDGLAQADPARDLLKIAVVERHHGTGRLGLGFIHGLGLKRGALASSVAHDSHNIIVAGTSDEEMRAAVAELVAMGGGLVAVKGGSAVARLALPIAGLMSEQPMTVVHQAVEELLRAARCLGCVLPDPFMTLSFMALPVIPALKITDQGLVDVEKFRVVPLFVEDSTPG
jgi:adenine deaminase